MEIFTPGAWEGVGVVTVVVVFFLLGVLSLVRGWIIFGPAHQAIVKALQAAADHSNEREKTDAETIANLTSVVMEQKVAGEMSVHIMKAVRDATEALHRRPPTDGASS